MVAAGRAQALGEAEASLGASVRFGKMGCPDLGAGRAAIDRLRRFADPEIRPSCWACRRARPVSPICPRPQAGTPGRLGRGAAGLLCLAPAPYHGSEEGWPSGRRRTPGERVYGFPVSWVRIPPPPPRTEEAFTASWVYGDGGAVDGPGVRRQGPRGRPSARAADAGSPEPDEGRANPTPSANHPKDT